MLTRLPGITSIVLILNIIALGGCESNDRSAAETIECEENSALSCIEEQCTLKEECVEETPHCVSGLGCTACIPDGPACGVEGNVYECGADGQTSALIEECPSGNCQDGKCLQYCESNEDKSYRGCRFVAVTTLNSELNSLFSSDFAVVVGNPGTVTAHVVVQRRGQNVTAVDLEPGAVEAIQLPMQTALTSRNHGESGTRLAKRAAYFILSTAPIIAYQYNPLHYSLPDAGANYNSYTNDASLLLPLHTLTTSYRVNTWPTWGAGNGGWFPGFAAVAAIENDTVISLSFEDSDETIDVELERGDVYQVASIIPTDPVTIYYCESQGGVSSTTGDCGFEEDTDNDSESNTEPCRHYCSLTPADLSGMKVDANHPVAVFAGHDCIYVPANMAACDHLEEMMLPVDSWGKSAVLTAPVHPDGASKGVSVSYYRVLADMDDTQITLTPSVVDPITLNAAEVYQFSTDRDFEVTGNNRFYITQTFAGQHANDAEHGDPAMGTGIPLAQSRGEYVFLVPETYTDNYVNVVAKTGTTVSLDGTNIVTWTPIEQTLYSVSRLRLEPGTHRVSNKDSGAFTITSYGYAPYTSYLFPGGMNVEPIAQ